MKNLHPQLQKCHEKFNLANSSPLFDYSETIYNGTDKDISVKCIKCNEYFNQMHRSHLRYGITNCSCNKIAREKERITKLNNTLPLFIEKALLTNDNKNEFNYEKTRLILKSKRQWATNIKCNKCLHLFDQRVDKHLEGQGCKRCRSHIHDIETYRGRPTTLYFIQVNKMYKIGLTMSSLKNRFSKEKNNPLIETIQEIKIWTFEKGEEAYNLEQQIIKENKDVKYNNKENGDLFQNGGNSELFTENIFERIVPLIELF